MGGVRAGRRPRVPSHRRAALLVPSDVQHGGQPRAAVLARDTRITCSTCRSRSSTPIAMSSPWNASSSGPESSSDGSSVLARSDYGDIEEYRRLVERRDAERRGQGASRRIASALEALRPGDVIWVGSAGRQGRGAEPRGAARFDAAARALGIAPAGAARSRRARHAPDADRAPRSPRAVRAPQPAVPAGGRRPAPPGEGPTPATLGPRGSGGRARGGGRRAPGRHAIRSATRSCAPPRLPSGSSATSRASTRRVKGRSESLARQLDRVQGVLEAWGYVDGWALTDAGRDAGTSVHRDRPAARRVDPGRSPRRARAHPRPPRSCRASPTSDAGPTTRQPSPPARWPSTKVAGTVATTSNGLWRTWSRSEDDARAPRDAGSRSRIHALCVRVGEGRRPRRGPRGRRARRW